MEADQELYRKLEEDGRKSIFGLAIKGNIETQDTKKYLCVKDGNCVVTKSKEMLEV